LNTWLNHAGYIGAKNDNSQIPGQVVVFQPKNLRSPWAKFNPKKAESANLLHSAKDQTETPEFKKWFGDSKVVDADGKPLVVYHGTAGSFNEFRASNIGTMGPGMYFTFSYDKAKEWASRHQGGRVIAAYLKAENPIKIASTADASELFDRFAPEGSDREMVLGLRNEGFDAVWATGSSSTPWGDTEPEIVVFDPTQIKSATDNNGNFDGTNPDIRHSRKDIIGKTARQYTPDQLKAFANVGFETEVPSLKERAQAIWKDAGKKLAQGIFDQFAPIKDIDTTAYGLMRLAKGASGAFETILRGGKLKLTDNVYDFDETDKGGVVDKLLTPMQGEHHDFLRWVAANRADRLIGEDKEHLFSQDDIDAIKTLEDGDLTFDYTLKNGPNQGQVTRIRSEMYRDSLITFNEFNTNVLDMAEQSGLIDGDSRQYWEHEFYVPFYRVSEEDGFLGAKIKGGAVRQQAFKKLKGGKDALNPDLLDNTLMNWAHLLDASAKNRAAKATLEAAESMGVALSSDEETARQIGKATGNKNGVVWFMDDGVQHYYVVEDPFVLQAITSLEYAGMRNPAMNALGAMKHMLTVGVTASPFFKIRNLIRDSVQVIGTGNIAYNPVKNVVDGWKLTDPKNDILFRLLAGGGTIHFGTMLEGTEAKRVQALVESGVHESTILGDEHKIKAFYRKFIEPSIEAYNELGNRGEAVNRASLYDQLVKQGVSHSDASLQARDLMDFSMQGSFTSVRFLTQIVPFLNARLQGMYKLGRAAKEDPRRMAYVTGAVVLASLGLLAAYGDDDDWRKRESWDRENFWWFKFGGTAFRIPKPFEIGAIGTLAERSAELMFDSEMTKAKFGESVIKILGDNLSMNPIPQLVKPMIDIYANKDSFSGRPIESMSMERVESEYRFNSGTSMTARALSTASNAVTGLVGKDSLSPVQIDHLIRGYFGWLGTFIVGSADIPARWVTSQADKPTKDLWKAASGGMISQLEDAPSKYVSAVYDQAKAVDEAYGTWKAMLKEGKIEEAAAYRADNLEKIQLHKGTQAIKGAITKINQQIKAIERSDMDPGRKRDEILRLNARKDQFARRLATKVG